MRVREEFLDKLRVMAACAVVMLHTVSGVMDSVEIEWFSPEKRVFLTVWDLVCWCVPVFVMISGYLFLNPERKLSFGTMLSKYCRRIVLALFLFGAPYACLEQIATERCFRVGMLWKSFVLVLQGKSWAHMWYLYLILFLYLLTPGMKWMLARIPAPAVYALAAALAFGGSVLPFLAKALDRPELEMLPSVTIYFFYYICGYLFAVHGNARRKRQEESPRPALPLAMLLIAAGVVASRFFEGYRVYMGYNYPPTVALALLLFGWCMSRDRSGEERTASPVWTAASSLTFAVYLVHPVFLNIAYKFLGVTPLDFCVFASLPLFYLATLLLAFGAAWVLGRIPLLKKYVL